MHLWRFHLDTPFGQRLDCPHFYQTTHLVSVVRVLGLRFFWDGRCGGELVESANFGCWLVDLLQMFWEVLVCHCPGPSPSCKPARNLRCTGQGCVEEGVYQRLDLYKVASMSVRSVCPICSLTVIFACASLLHHLTVERGPIRHASLRRLTSLFSNHFTPIPGCRFIDVWAQALSWAKVVHQSDVSCLSLWSRTAKVQENKSCFD